MQLFDNLPALNLSVPANRDSTDCVELNEALICEWIKQLPQNDIEQYVLIYSEALTRFNSNRLDPLQRLILLDSYRKALNTLIHQLNSTKLARYIEQADSCNSFIEAFTELLLVLAMGYKIVLLEALKKDTNLKQNQLAMMAINRTVEQLSITALFAYKFYRSTPARLLNELHQLYLLVLKDGVEEKQAKLTGLDKAKQNVKSMYSQLMLLSICNPYGLAEGAVVNAYQVMANLGSEINIRPMKEDEKAVAGHFYINCLSDKPPTPSMLRKLEDQTHPPTLVLDTKPALVKFDLLFQRSQMADLSSKGVDIELLKQLAPYLNTSYERKQFRTNLSGDHQVTLAIGLEPVYQSVLAMSSSAPELSADIAKQWRMLNKNSSGYLVSRTGVAEKYDIKVGGLVSVFEGKEGGQQAKIGFVRWIKTNHHDVTKMGLMLIEGQPVAVGYQVDNSAEKNQGLFLPELGRINQPASLITRKGVFKPNCAFKIKPSKKRFQFDMVSRQLLSQGKEYEHFTLEEGESF